MELLAITTMSLHDSTFHKADCTLITMYLTISFVSCLSEGRCTASLPKCKLESFITVTLQAIKNK